MISLHLEEYDQEIYYIETAGKQIGQVVQQIDGLFYIGLIGNNLQIVIRILLTKQLQEKKGTQLLQSIQVELDIHYFLVEKAKTDTYLVQIFLVHLLNLPEVLVLRHLNLR